jgi:hypothetical protein
MPPVQETYHKIYNNLLLRVLEDLIRKALMLKNYIYVLHWPCTAIKNYTAKYCAKVLRNKSTSSHTVPSDFYKYS